MLYKGAFYPEKVFIIILQFFAIGLGIFCLQRIGGKDILNKLPVVTLYMV